MSENNYSRVCAADTEIDRAGEFMRQIARDADMPPILAGHWVQDVLDQMRRVAAAAARRTVQ